METQTIVVRGAREHNLQGVNLEMPRHKLIVFTGVSGSGKSSLAFDTIYAEGQRRYVESLSSYARQFLRQLPKPDVDYIGRLSPAVSIQQKTTGRNPRSTVGTITEVSDFLRVLYARLGQGHCPRCGRPIPEAVWQALSLADGNLIVSVESEAGGEREAPVGDEEAGAVRHPLASDILLSAHYACTHCSISYEPPTPQLFSFNSPHGMCPECDGLGSKYTFDPDLLVPDPTLSFHDGAVPVVGPLKGMGRWRKHIYEGVAKSLGIDLKLPWREMPEQHRNWVVHGSGDAHIVWEWKQRGGHVWKHGGKWEGIVPQLLSQFKKTAAGPR